MIPLAKGPWLYSGLVVQNQMLPRATLCSLAAVSPKLLSLENLISLCWWKMRRRIFWEIVEEVAAPEISTLPITNYARRNSLWIPNEGSFTEKWKQGSELQLRELGKGRWAGTIVSVHFKIHKMLFDVWNFQWKVARILRRSVHRSWVAKVAKVWQAFL